MRETTVGEKRVPLSEPYDPRFGLGEQFFGRRAEMEMVIAAWLARPGVGKGL